MAFEAIGRLPGLRYLGPAGDALGHRGVAVAEDGIGIPAFQLPGANPPRQDFRFTLIFDPATGRVLGAHTTLLSRLPLTFPGPGGDRSEARAVQNRAIPRRGARGLKPADSAGRIR